ncbi:tRNA (adenosine(37)-N6)-threonylcarbamoyltransferase complex transferase subunit TsaD [Pararhodospirillum oryzae]|uniref:tRNA N6-adenosine threonylcarbamoyltransferase n=1 Tax=Pararhodospirillum oryzae TaxID=478448 RepID=A0A512HBI7_9PROT|nr:tRNA (adenosine(37)-N6)-threonylcarbamoyltransferase complex transferase subunit TsaD [Pararhodospirillum oryzae]GEO82802.1 tRNA N6-adenosine threonylcarbamoyltransferase [Pararhodospirillum oryzae]
MGAYRVLGLETSCDETAAAIVEADRGDDGTSGGQTLAQALRSQIDEHRPFGGVVPEIAARAHLDILDGLVARALADSGLALRDLDAVAATAGPGLIGGVLVGVMTAKALALASGLPFIAVNHLEAHALTARLQGGLAFPYLLVLASGGHCQFLAVEGVGACRRLGTTIDDAAGEAFDKAAKMLGLGHPGGPAVEKAARLGDPARFALPRPLVGRPGCDLSFSGLKTALRQTVERLGPTPPTPQDIHDLCAGFQQAIADCLADRARAARHLFAQRHGPGHALVLAGGVAANQTLRAALARVADEAGMVFAAPPPALCTDNAAMVAWTGIERLRLGLTDPLDFRARPRWPLDPDAPPATGAGRVKA